MKSPIFAMVIAILLCTFAFAGSLPFAFAQNGENVGGLITSDTTWRVANSPYNLTETVKVAPGATLTIEPGTVVCLNLFFLEINGTLNARGTNSEPINFNCGSPMIAGVETMLRTDFGSEIVFEPSSTSWNSQTQKGSIVENSIISSLAVNGGSPKISSSTLLNIDVFGGSAEISNNNIIGGIGVYSGPTLISGNTISQQTHYFWQVIAQRYDRNNAVILIGNNATALIYDNILRGDISQVGAGIGFGIETSLRNCQANLVNNTIYGFKGAGIDFSDGSGNVAITDNNIQGCSEGIVINGTGRNEDNSNLTIATTIQRNIISNNTNGIEAALSTTIQNNTFTNNKIAIVTSAVLTLNYNNFDGNFQDVYLSSLSNLDAINNWWGTTNSQTIDQSIYDYKNNHDIGNVTFTPFLTAPNQQATPNPSVPPSIPELTMTATIIMLAVGTITIMLNQRKRIRYQSNSSESNRSFNLL